MHLRQILTLLAALLLLAGCQRNLSDATADAGNDVPVRIDFLDVGKADCIVIRCGDEVAMIDTGTAESFAVVKDFLDAEGIQKIDLLLLTHFDKDHVGGAADLLMQYPVGQVMSTYYEAKESEEIDKYHQALEQRNMSPILVSLETELSLGDVSLKIYPPEQGEYKNDTSNNSSLVIHMTYGEKAFLFTGDAEKERIKEILEIPGIQADLIKMPHHGKGEKNTAEMLEYISPKYAVITSSAADPEDKEVLLLLDVMDIKTYLTRRGDVKVSCDGHSLEIAQ